MTELQKETIDLEALEAESKRLWQLRQKANDEWYAVQRQVTELREKARIEALVEARLQDKLSEKGKGGLRNVFKRK